MSLLRDSAIVGAATFLVGSVLMEVNVKQEGEAVGWWPYVGTFIAGSLGFYLLAANDVVKVKNAEGPTDDELESWSERQDDGSMLVMIDEDGDSHTELTYDEGGDLTDLKRFMAEAYEAERKLRRRTTFSWARGIDPAFSELTGLDWVMNDPYEGAYKPYSSQGDYMKDGNAYYIKQLPEGYHLHLWKPQSRRHSWKMYMKSPGKKWKRELNNKKGQMKIEALEWYNTAIAKPEEYSLSPIEQMMISQGMRLDVGTIARQEIINRDGSVVKHKHKDCPEDCDITWEDADGLSISEPPVSVDYYYAPPQTKPIKFASAEDINRVSSDYRFALPTITFYKDALQDEIKEFALGLKYMGVKGAGNLRSVNRFNQDKEQWVKSFPAWFQNMCRLDIDTIKLSSIDGRAKTWQINEKKFLRFTGDKLYGSTGSPVRTAKPLSPVKATPAHQKDHDDWMDIPFGGLKSLGIPPQFQVFIEDPNDSLESWGSNQWIFPRLDTQRKMYRKAIAYSYGIYPNEMANEGLRPDLIRAHIFLQCVEKYQPQKFADDLGFFRPIRNGNYNTGFGTPFDQSVMITPSGQRLDPVIDLIDKIGQLMARRTKKN